MIEKKTIWFDFTNVPHVSFLLPIINHFHKANHIYSIREFAETRSLFEKLIGKDHSVIGSHQGKNKIKKTIGSLSRINALYKQIPYFDYKISVGGDASSIVTKVKKKISITFDDNEKAPNWRYSKFSDLAFWPDCIEDDVLQKQGFKQHKIFKYNGFKEDLYIADYIPDRSFTSTLPFSKYVVLRPENIKANYVNNSAGSIVPDLLERLHDLGVNVLFLPRYKNDKELAKGFNNVYIPNNALNGLDACYYSDAVFTGAGTLARESACLGIPAFSFYSGKELLSVDRKMIALGWLYFSRNADDLIWKFQKAKKQQQNIDRSKKVKTQIINKLDEFINSNKQ